LKTKSIWLSRKIRCLRNHTENASTTIRKTKDSRKKSLDGKNRRCDLKRFEETQKNDKRKGRKGYFFLSQNHKWKKSPMGYRVIWDHSYRLATLNC
jgi:hypothetical protein